MPTRYPNVRRLLAAPHRALPDRMVEQVIAAQGLEAQAIEGFWDTLGGLAGGVLGTFIAGCRDRDRRRPWLGSGWRGCCRD